MYYSIYIIYLQQYYTIIYQTMIWNKWPIIKIYLVICFMLICYFYIYLHLLLDITFKKTIFTTRTRIAQQKYIGNSSRSYEIHRKSYRKESLKFSLKVNRVQTIFNSALLFLYKTLKQSFQRFSWLNIY